MKKDQVQIGQTYNAKITDKVVPVRIDAEHKSGGWHGTNMTTNRKVHIKTAQKLRSKFTAGTEKPTDRKPAKKKLSAAERKAMLAQHKADQENARMRDERKTNAKGMTASEEAMATSAKTKRTKKPKDAPAKDKKLSLIAAAAEVLGKKKEPMTTKEMVDHVVTAGLWTPGAGKTPHATLYSAILRDLKSEFPRFEKVNRGQFTLAPGMKKGA
jgi:hypothetical protein